MDDNRLIRCAIGVPGEAPRMFATAPRNQIMVNVRENEVIVQEANFIDAPHIISADGLTLEEVPETLEEAQARTWTAAKFARTAVEQGGCATALGRVQTTSSSQLKINAAAGAALRAKMAETEWSVDWTMEDNTVVTHDADQMLTMADAVMQHLDGCHAAGEAVRSMIMASTSVEEVDAIDVTGFAPDDK